MTVKDGSNNSFTNIATYIPNAGFCQYIYAIATPAGDVGTTPVLTAHTTTGSPIGMAILVQEVSGLATIPTADGSPGTSNGSASNGANFGPPVYSDSASGEYLVYADYRFRQQRDADCPRWIYGRRKQRPGYERQCPGCLCLVNWRHGIRALA